MARRIFIKIIIGIIGLLTLGFWGMESTLRNKIIGKIKFKLKPSKEVQPYSNRSEYEFPTGSKTVSVEMALNSRCTSDYTGNQEYHHWGMFDKTKRLTDEQTNRIVDLAKVPRFTVKKIGIVTKQNVLTFIIENIPAGLQRDWLMVESGMQQQAVGLVCAALGVGMVFRNLGKDGRLIENNNDYGTVRIKIDPMQPSYNGSFWSSDSPSGRKSWLNGNLSDPVRDGELPLISTLTDLNIENQGKTKANKTAISQLLWAARGRTPHLYKAKPWGMTIPFWTDKIEISSVYLVMDQKLYKYINWESGRPTHSIVKLGSVDQHVTDELLKIFPQKKKFIFISRNDDYARAAWEIGYQLINLLMQAKVLDVAYQTILLDETLQKLLGSTGIRNPVALLAV